MRGENSIVLRKMTGSGNGRRTRLSLRAGGRIRDLADLAPVRRGLWACRAQNADRSADNGDGDAARATCEHPAGFGLVALVPITVGADGLPAHIGGREGAPDGDNGGVPDATRISGRAV